MPITTIGEQAVAASSVREAERPYRIDEAATSRWQQAAPPASGTDHTLGLWQIVVRVMLIALASMLLAGAALNLVRSTGLVPRDFFPER